MGFFFAISIFVPMKKKLVILNYFLMFTVLFSMLFQSMHSYEHLAKQFSEKKCHHKYISNQEITHHHHNLDHCFVCNFALSNFIASDFSSFEFKKVVISSGYSFFKSGEITQFFKGSLFALRAPPNFIV
jgi:spore maturation protein CgeB